MMRFRKKKSNSENHQYLYYWCSCVIARSQENSLEACLNVHPASQCVFYYYVQAFQIILKNFVKGQVWPGGW